MELSSRAGARLKCAGTIIAASLLGACQSYEASPLDLSLHRDAFLARDASAAGTVAGDAAFDLVDGVTLREAEAVAMVYNADLRVARRRAGVSLASAANAGLWEDPVVGVDLTRIVESVQHPWKVMSSVALTIPLSGRLEIEKQLAGAEHHEELARVAQLEWETRMNLRRDWTAWAAARSQLEATEELLGGIEQVLEVVGRMERAGEVSRTQASLFRIELGARRAEALSLEAFARRAELDIRRRMGVAPQTPMKLDPTSLPPHTDAPAPLTEMIVGLEDRNPALLAARAAYEAAERSLELEVRRQYPDLVLGPGYGNEDGVNEVLLGVSVPLPIFNANTQAIARARAARELARESAAAEMETIISDAHAACVAIEATRRHRELLEAEIVPLVRQQYDDARRLASMGEVDTLVLLESLSRLHDARARQIEAQRDERLARISLDELLGPPARPVHAGAAPQEVLP